MGAGSFSESRKRCNKLPIILVKIGNCLLSALVDSGCTDSIITTEAVRRLSLKVCPAEQIVSTIGNLFTKCEFRCMAQMEVDDVFVTLDMMVNEALVANCDILLGNDAISLLGGVTVKDGAAKFGAGPAHVKVSASGQTSLKEASTPMNLCIEESDFSASFQDGRWTVRWKWREGEPQLKNQCGGYAVKDEDREAFDTEVEQWIEKGWLQPHDVYRHGPVAGVIPLMAVVQLNKKKVRPVLDYRELNTHVKSNPGVEASVCGEKLREWRRMGTSVAMLDLSKAYLQLHISPELQRFQAVRYKGTRYVLSRLGFGLASAPKIMTKVLGKVLSLRPDVSAGTSSYIDDILVNTAVVSAEAVKAHLKLYGLEAKDPVPLNGARVLGLHVSDRGSGYQWKRDNPLPNGPEGELTKRQLFSVCGQLVSHYPVVGWLRVACSYVKRVACDGAWDEEVPTAAKCMLDEVLRRVSTNDPARGQWSVGSGSVGTVWCDASSLALGVCIDIDGSIVEDASWLRKKDDGSHINVAELEAVIKGVNLALKWGLTHLDIITDSATVHGWVGSVVNDEHRPKVTGCAEMLVRRRLGLITALMDEYSLEITITLVPSARNRADELTRVPKAWLVTHPVACPVVVEGDPTVSIRVLHRIHHLGVNRTLHLARKQLGRQVSRKEVSSVVRSCQECQRIDPAPVRWETGSLEVEETWKRLAIDVTHVRSDLYLTIVDCGPSRLAVWRKLRNETAAAVSAHLETLFCERGPPQEILSDNGPAFRSQELTEFLSKWTVSQRFSCAYRPSGNGIVERNHRTIKRMVARSGGSVESMLYFYNNSPNDSGVVPSSAVFRYAVTVPRRGSSEVNASGDNSEPVSSPFCVGESVYVQTPGSRCMTPWELKTVTAVISPIAVEVGGIPRHISNVRKLENRGTSGSNSVHEADGNVPAVRPSVGHRMSSRARHPPAWMNSYV